MSFAIWANGAYTFSPVSFDYAHVYDSEQDCLPYAKEFSEKYAKEFSEKHGDPAVYHAYMCIPVGVWEKFGLEFYHKKDFNLDHR